MTKTEKYVTYQIYDNADADTRLQEYINEILYIGGKNLQISIGGIENKFLVAIKYDIEED